MGEVINALRRAGVISFPQIWCYPCFKLLKTDRGTAGDLFGKISNNEECLTFRMMCDGSQCFPQSQLITAETFEKAANEKIPL